MRQKQDLLSESLECFMHCVVLVTFARTEKKKNLCLFKQTLRPRFTLSRVVFGQSAHISGLDTTPVLWTKKVVKRQDVSMVFDSLNNGTVYLYR